MSKTVKGTGAEGRQGAEMEKERKTKSAWT